MVASSLHTQSTPASVRAAMAGIERTENFRPALIGNFNAIEDEINTVTFGGWRRGRRFAERMERLKFYFLSLFVERETIDWRAK